MRSFIILVVLSLVLPSLSKPADAKTPSADAKTPSADAKISLVENKLTSAKQQHQRVRRMAAAQRQAPAAKSTPGEGCHGFNSCAGCTGVTFCLWHSTENRCEADINVGEKELYSYYKGSCTTLAGHWENLSSGAGADDEDYSYKPLMMQPPALANQDEGHIFQGAFPRPDYGKGELGYKLQGIDIGKVRGYDDNPEDPAHPCYGQPLHGCLQKPVIIPVGHYAAYGFDGEKRVHSNVDSYGEHPVQAKFRQKMTDKANYVNPVFNENYDDKDDLDKDE